MTESAPYKLADFYAMHVAYPDSAVLPDPQQVRALRPGDFAKLAFIPAHPDLIAETMWVQVTGVRDSCTFAGTLDNEPASLPLHHGAPVEFSAAHIAAVRFR